MQTSISYTRVAKAAAFSSRPSRAARNTRRGCVAVHASKEAARSAAAAALAGAYVLGQASLLAGPALAAAQPAGPAPVADVAGLFDKTSRFYKKESAKVEKALTEAPPVAQPSTASTPPTLDSPTDAQKAIPIPTVPELLESVAEKETLPEGTDSEIRILAQQERDAQERPNLLNNEAGPERAGTNQIKRTSAAVTPNKFAMLAMDSGSSPSSLKQDASSYNDPALPGAVNEAASRLSLGQRQAGDVSGSRPSQLRKDAADYNDPALPGVVNEAAGRLSLGQRESGDVGGSSKNSLLKLARGYSDPLLSNKGTRKAADAIKSNVGSPNINTPNVGKSAKQALRKASKNLSGSPSDAAQTIKDQAGDAGDAIQEAARSAKGKVLRRINYTNNGTNQVVDNLAAVNLGGRSNYDDPAIPDAVSGAAAKLSAGQRQAGDVGGSSPSQLRKDASDYNDPALPAAVSEAAGRLSLGQRTSGDVGGSSVSELKDRAESYSDPLLSNNAGDKVAEAASGAVSAVKDNVPDSPSGINLPSLPSINLPGFGSGSSNLADKAKAAADDTGDALGRAAADAKGSLLKNTSSVVNKAYTPILDNLAAVNLGGRSNYDDPAIPDAVSGAAAKLSAGQRQAGDVSGSSPSQLRKDASDYNDPALPGVVSEAAGRLSLGQRTSGDVGGSSVSELKDRAESYSDPLLSNKAADKLAGAAGSAASAVKDATR